MESIEKNKNIFFIVLTSLVLFGVLMVYSSSYLLAKEVYLDSNYFIFKHLKILALSIMVSLIISKMRFHFIMKMSWPIFILCSFCLLLTLLPSIGKEVKGSSRWITLFGGSIQPAEFFKISLVLVTIKYFENFFYLELKKRLMASFALFIPFLILLAQPDFGTFAIGLMVCLYVCFLSKFPRKYFYSLIGFFTSAVSILIVMAPYRVKRLMSFLDPWADPQGSGFQVIQSFLAFAKGAWFGKGIGSGQEKLFYLPEAHNDFIFSVLAEEQGLFGVTICIFLFLGLIYTGLKLALAQERRENAIFMCTVIFLIGLQAVLNMGVVLGLLPTKGLNLPFISSGGSSLIGHFILIGLFFSALKEKSYIKSAQNEGVLNSSVRDVDQTHYSTYYNSQYNSQLKNTNLNYSGLNGNHSSTDYFKRNRSDVNENYKSEYEKMAKRPVFNQKWNWNKTTHSKLPD